MHQTHFAIARKKRTVSVWALAALASALIAACGGDDTPAYSRMVVFGDSLSDVGTYATPGIKQIGGGKYTINGPDAKIWVELLADRAGLAKPCAAQTGLESSGQLAGFAAPITNVPDCFGYAQGGARVTELVGPANKALLAVNNPQGALGQLTVPLVAQVDRHLSVANNRFSGSELVTVLAGGNDLFMNLGTFAATAQAGGDAQAAANAAVAEMGKAGTELATLIRTKMVANGAQRVVVVNLPDVSKTPFGLSLDSNTRGLVQQMVITFNTELGKGLSGVSGVLAIDGYGTSQAIAANPAAYGVDNATTPACDPAVAQLGSLSCSAATTLAGKDVSKYQYADDVHPTPLGYQLIVKPVVDAMVAAGWL